MTFPSTIKRRIGLAALSIFIASSYFYLRPFGHFPAIPWSAKDFIQTLKILSIPLVWLLIALFLTRMRAGLAALSAYLCFIVYIAAEHSILASPLHNITLLAYTAVALAFAMTLYVLSCRPIWKWARILGGTIISSLLLIVLLVPLAFVVYHYSLGIPLQREAIFAVLQTNPLEASEYVTDFISAKAIIGALAVFLIALVATLGQLIKTHASGRPKTAIVLIVILCAFGALKRHEFNVPKHTYYTVQSYYKIISAFRKLQNKRAQGLVPIVANKNAQNETYVVIIGESLTRTHMGIYGYFRPTTPQLAALKNEGSLLVYKNAFSNHTHTMPTLSWALTDANQFNGKSYFHSASLVNVANAARFMTYWISNQNMAGPWDNLVSIIGHSADVLVSLNHGIGRTTTTDVFDGALIPHLKKVITSGSDGNRMIFVHLMGNHGNYCTRYPKRFDQFEGPLYNDRFGATIANDPSRWHRINCYDNSVLYNDHVVSALIDTLKAQGGVAAAIYFSDHGDDVYAGLGHNSAKFHWPMAAIPVIVWTSDAYNQRYPQKAANLRKHRPALFTNDLVFDTVIGLAGIQTAKGSPQYDLTSQYYAENPHKAATLHGKKPILSADDYIWWRKANHRKLERATKTDRVVPGLAVSIGELSDIWRSGYRSFAVTVAYDRHSSQLLVDSPNGPQRAPLAEFLQHIDVKHLQNLVINVNNLNADTSRGVKDALRRLNAKYNIKENAIVVSSNAGSWFNLLAQLNWKTSYKLSLDLADKRIQKVKQGELKALAKDIATRVIKQGVSGISFDAHMYPFVSHILQNDLPKNVKYHVTTEAQLASPGFFDSLTKRSFYTDVRVTTIGVQFWSHWD